MTQIDYTNTFKDGRWADGYTEVNDPRPSGYYLKYTMENRKRVEEYLKNFEFEKADDLYKRLSNRYRYKDYSDLKNKYIKKAQMIGIIKNKGNNKKIIDNNIIFLKCNNCGNFRKITSAYIKDKSEKLYLQIEDGDFLKSFKKLLVKKKNLFRCSECGQKKYSLLSDSKINEERKFPSTRPSRKYEKSEPLNKKFPEKQKPDIETSNNEVRISKKSSSWDQEDINYQPWNYGSPKGNHWR